MAKKHTYYVVQIANAYVSHFEDGSRCALTTSCLNKAKRFDKAEQAERVADAIYATIEKDHDVSVFKCEFERVLQHRKARKRKGEIK